jgi:NADP-dependent aldehyde dehydrogenase
MTSDGQVDASCRAAAAAFTSRSLHPVARRVELLRRVAEGLETARDRIVTVADEETSLGDQRLHSELTRTTGQLGMFADLLGDASWMDIRIETAPVDVRRTIVPLGPVAVFGASNFPLAFSVPGGDTASALAAGCPVVAKAHPAHPRTCAVVGEIIADAVRSLGLPSGCFGLVSGGVATGMALVDHPAIAAIGFTGSRAGGRSIFDRAAQRPIPIPVYAEMGSTNPVFVLPGAVGDRGAEIAAALAGSVTLGSGQFCTKPGLIFGLDDAAIGELAVRLDAASPGTMLTAAIAAAYAGGVAERIRIDGVELAAGAGEPGRPTLLRAALDVVLASPELMDEVFGPVTIAVEGSQGHAMLDAAETLDGQLAASIFCEPSDLELALELADVLQDRVGRIVWNDVPTGVAVNHAMHHGGPYPASTSSAATSVGSAAIWRFSRPVCWQGAPAWALPPELDDSNPLHITRLVNGERTTRASVAPRGS